MGKCVWAMFGSEDDYKSKWIDDYRPLLNARRELIIKDARVYAF